METPFFLKSKEVANDFLQSIVFLDDKAYNAKISIDGSKQNVNQNEFDTFEISKAFAKEKKICAAYCPQTIDDIQHFTEISRKADVVILDWYIEIKDMGIESSDPEADAEVDDPRGQYTKGIITELVSNPLGDYGGLKLIIIYTGETNLEEITQDVFNSIPTIYPFVLNQKECRIDSPNIKILIRAKSSVTEGEDYNKFKHLPQHKDKILKYAQLPSFVLNEFTKITSGLLSNFILKSLSLIRKNTFNIISLYNKDLDDAFFLHKLLLPNPDESIEQLIEMASHSIQSILNYQNDNKRILPIELLDCWIDEKQYNISKKICNKEHVINNEFLKGWIRNGYYAEFKKYWHKKGWGDIDKNKLDNGLTDIAKKEGSNFIQTQENINKDFEYSILTHHKSNLKQKFVTPKLTLGSVVCKIEDGKKTYFLCIQAKCDSVRLIKDTRFIFLPLNEIEGMKAFNFIVMDTDAVIKLKYEKNSYSLKTFKFKPEDGVGSVLAKKQDDNFVFKTIYNEELKWLCDLKDLHAQRIANIFASELSRVGLDESEWLRRSH